MSTTISGTSGANTVVVASSVGTSGQVLTSNGTGQTPSFQTPTTTIADSSIALSKLVPVGTSGQVLTSTGSGTAPTFQTIATGGFSNMVVITSTQTWTVPAGITKAKVTVVGGGGGTQAGGSGGTSSFGSFCSATGGSGVFYPSGTFGAGGSGIGGDLNVGGGGGAYATGTVSGGSSILGGGGATGSSGRSYGGGAGGLAVGCACAISYFGSAGGGGASKKICTLTPGQGIICTVGAGGTGYVAGAPGVIIIEY